MIQLSTENKINSKNSWSLDLIDHIDHVLTEENAEKPGDDDADDAPPAASEGAGGDGAGVEETKGDAADGAADADAAEARRRAKEKRRKRRSVNFQKASCTLDASIKIYSARVDDVHGESYRVLETLTRSSDGKAGGARGGGKAPVAAVAKRSWADRAGA